MNKNRLQVIDAGFLNDVVEELARAREKFPGNHHMLGAFHEEVGEVAKAMLERDYAPGQAVDGGNPRALDVEVYWECVQAAAMALRVATEGDPEYLYENPHYRELEDDYSPPMPLPEPGELIEIDINEVQVQLDSNQKFVKLTHQPTGQFIYCDKHDTQWENQAAGLKMLSELVRDHLQWAPQDDALVIPGFLRRGDGDE
jgi:hypothetical protein